MLTIPKVDNFLLLNIDDISKAQKNICSIVKLFKTFTLKVEVAKNATCDVGMAQIFIYN
jgi:hypothetical protein